MSGCGAEFLGHRGIHADAFAGCEPVSVRDGVGDRARGALRAQRAVTARRAP